MQDEQLDDLKQFIEATVSQSEQRIKDELRDELGGKIDSVRDELKAEMQSGFEGIGEAIDHINETTTDHDSRISKLEQRAA